MFDRSIVWGFPAIGHGLYIRYAGLGVYDENIKGQTE
jgi:hypothetical protein